MGNTSTFDVQYSLPAKLPVIDKRSVIIGFTVCATPRSSEASFLCSGYGLTRFRPVNSLIALLALLSAFVLNSCDQGIGPETAFPAVSSITVEPNPFNVVAAVVTIHATGASTAWVAYRKASGPLLSTPPSSFIGNVTTIDVLGLRPETSYEFLIFVNTEKGSSVTSAPLVFVTKALPSDLPKLVVPSSSSPSPGYVMIGISPSQPSDKTYAMIIDNEGNVVWYRKFNAAVADFQKQPNGHYTAYSSLDGGASRYYEMDGGGRVLQEITADDPLNTDSHELRVVDGNHYLFGIERRTMDLTAMGGDPNAIVRGISVEKHFEGLTSFRWTTFDHFDVSDAAPDISITGAQVNPWHGNALEIEADGNILASFRNADVIAKINAVTGAIIWRLGGKNNDFTFINDQLDGFSHQHGIRKLQNGHVILFDNGNLHNPPVSRAVEYALDETAKTATLVWEYRGAPELYSFAVGNAQRLENGNTLICFGLAQHVLEVDREGAKHWELIVNEPNHYPYRAFRIDSLY